MPPWKVEEHGSRLSDFIGSITDDRAFDEAVALIKLLGERGNLLRWPRSEALGSGLFELRGKQVRIFYVFRPGRRVVLLDGIIKRTTSFPTSCCSVSDNSKPRSNKMAKRKKEFMAWLDGEIERRGREREVAALVDEMLVEEQLAELRRKRGISQARLAQLMGVQQPLIARMESGRVKNLTLSTIARMAATLGARVELRIVPSRMKRQKATAQQA